MSNVEDWRCPVGTMIDVGNASHFLGKSRMVRRALEYEMTAAHRHASGIVRVTGMVAQASCLA